MRASDLTNACPYTGLRSFTEEESLYFKGRDLQIDQITALLEQNKFLMVTGASGEGKSSLIYAGLIPNARAGFFRAKYSNWVVADFRPERSPVTNMAVSLATQFNSNPLTVETELRRGYSSLIDLYTSSGFYIEEDSLDASTGNAQELKEKKRGAANLIIIVDQFEEFFTNPENFFNEATSRDSQIVVNLILETARIAMTRNLPVYVVCTMRSDYIGQCSAFRGLPEFIGFSQFFVPRLKRKDLKQVIEEPALLSGLRISQRLIERLVFDIAEGVDQLPILQHALSRIWAAADHGHEELDLVHYAMVGGMPASELPDEDIPRFKLWFDAQPLRQREFYQQTGLDKIIEIHANFLYENAWEYYISHHPGDNITQQETKRIIALTFSCLTKIDNSRAVRNRMSLEEIAGIINSPRLTTEVVGAVLNIFREEGNSFIRPFMTDDPATHQLRPDAVLDITHESLIRNWNKLNEWANREFDFYSTFLDFQKQLERWKASGKSRGYLLPVGPLTYFENWYKKCKPNRSWIMRYAEVREDKVLAVSHAESKLSDTREFLKRSAKKEMVTRTIMKYGPRRIATLFAILAMLVLSGFYWYDADQKKNERVIEKIRSESFVLLGSKEVNVEDKSIYLITEERNRKGTLIPYLESVGFKSRISIGNEVYKQFLLMDKHEQTSLKKDVYGLISRNLSLADSSADPQFILEETNKFLVLLAMDQYYTSDPKKEDMLVALSELNYQHVLNFFNNPRLYHASVPSELNLAIHYWLAIGKATPEKITALLNAISPVAGENATKMFNLYYSKGSFEPNGRQSFDFNGGYLTIASLYAASGDIDHLIWCFDQLMKNNERAYFELPRILNNHLNLLEYLYQYGHRDEVPAMLKWIAVNTQDNPPVTVLRNAVLRSGYISHMYYINEDRGYYRSTRGLLYPNLCLAPRSVFDAMMEDYEKAITEIKDPNARNFELAMNFKRKAVFYSKYYYDRQIPVDQQRLDGWLKESLDYFSKLDKSFLEGEESITGVYNGDGVRTAKVNRRALYIYPDYRDGWFSWTYHTDYFFNYLNRNGLLPVFFKTSDDLKALHLWITKAFEWKTEVSPRAYSNPYVIPDETIKSVLAFVDQHPDGHTFDRNIIFLVLSNRAFERRDTVAGFQFYKQLNLSKIYNSSEKYEYLEKIFILNMMRDLCSNLAGMGKREEAIDLAEKCSIDVERVYSYNLMAEKVFKQNADPVAFVYLDSSLTKSKRYDGVDFPLEAISRLFQIIVLSEIGSKSVNVKVDELLSDVPGDFKSSGILARVYGIAQEGNYYRALTSIPNTLTETQDLRCRTEILTQACVTKEQMEGNIQWKYFDEVRNWPLKYVNYIPN